jgi:hypothetical protein
MRTGRAFRLVVALAALTLCSMPGCSASSAADRSVSSAAQGGVIDHVLPRPDSVGAAPTRFEWTKAAGAASYDLSVWNDVDVLVWRHADIRATEVPAPKGWEPEPGTYFWAVVGFRADGRPVAESGLAAFVVRD